MQGLLDILILTNGEILLTSDQKGFDPVGTGQGLGNREGRGHGMRTTGGDGNGRGWCCCNSRDFGGGWGPGAEDDEPFSLEQPTVLRWRHHGPSDIERR